MSKDNIYMLVTADECELPLTPPMTFTELGRLGVRYLPKTVKSDFRSNKKFNGEFYRIVQFKRKDLE